MTARIPKNLDQLEQTFTVYPLPHPFPKTSMGEKDRREFQEKRFCRREAKHLASSSSIVRRFWDFGVFVAAKTQKEGSWDVPPFPGKRHAAVAYSFLVSPNSGQAIQEVGADVEDLDFFCLGGHLSFENISRVQTQNQNPINPLF